MENASKALLIAAAVLVVIIIIAVGIKIYSSTTEAHKVGINTGETISEKTGQATDLAIAGITGQRNLGTTKFKINGTNNEKKAEDVVLGDDVTIDTEKFKVLKNDGSKITAIGYSNIFNVRASMDSEEITEQGHPTSVKFTDEKYWTSGDINMFEQKEDGSGYKNNIQQYINAYQNTLQKKGANNIYVRAPRYSDVDGLSIDIINKNKNSYWIATASWNGWLYICDSVGLTIISTYTQNGYAGIRPVIEITYK